MRRARGIVLLSLLFAVALIGLALTGAAQIWHAVAVREKERELLGVGDEIRRAIVSYCRSTPGRGAVGEYPERLEDLLVDPRYPMPRRHLRRIYRDPLGVGREWGLVRNQERIVGVYSQAPGVPLKQRGFAAADAGFADARSYADWRFVADGDQAAPPAEAGGASAAPPGCGSPSLAVPSASSGPTTEATNRQK